VHDGAAGTVLEVSAAKVKLVEEGKGCVGKVIDKGTLAINGGGAGGVGTAAILVLFDTGVCEAAVLAFGEAGGGEKFGDDGSRDVVGTVMTGEPGACFAVVGGEVGWRGHSAGWDSAGIGPSSIRSMS